jgi:hypothetical protein
MAAPDDRRPRFTQRLVAGFGRFVVSLMWGLLLAVVVFVLYLYTHRTF